MNLYQVILKKRKIIRQREESNENKKKEKKVKEQKEFKEATIKVCTFSPYRERKPMIITEHASAWSSVVPWQIVLATPVIRAVWTSISILSSADSTSASPAFL